ncbi:MAG: pyridoxal phosphate-dependent aminotransferase [Alphaproteobacteria bacterium]|nr:pyridoxal phosphate-dependent aminotransferase [Alphaproteobacteria bacterium]
MIDLLYVPNEQIDVKKIEDLSISKLLSEVNYSETGGLHAVREKVRRYIGRLVGASIKPETVFLTNGADQALCVALGAIKQIKGGSVYIQTPYYYKYPNQIRMVHGGKIKTQAATHPLLDSEHMLTAAKDANTSAVIFNNPNNPLGYIQPKQVLEHLLMSTLSSQAHLIYDTVYVDTLFDPSDEAHFKLPEDNGLIDRLWIVGSLSKSHGVAGWRLGFLVCPDKEKKRVAPILSALTSNLSTVSQRLVNIVLSSDFFEQRRQKLCTEMAANAQVIFEYAEKNHPLLFPNMIKPKAGIFFGLNNPAIKNKEDENHIQNELKKEGIQVLSGSIFGYPSVFRIPIATPLKDCTTFFQQVEKFFDVNRPDNTTRIGTRENLSP